MSNKPTQFFKQWRKFRGMTQEQAAERAGLARAYLSQLESGTKRHNEDILTKLANAYDCEPWELIGRDPSDDAPAYTEETAELVSIFEHMPKPKRKTLLDVAKGLDEQAREGRKD